MNGPDFEAALKAFISGPERIRSIQAPELERPDSDAFKRAGRAALELAVAWPEAASRPFPVLVVVPRLHAIPSALELVEDALEAEDWDIAAGPGGGSYLVARRPGDLEAVAFQVLHAGQFSTRAGLILAGRCVPAAVFLGDVRPRAARERLFRAFREASVGRIFAVGLGVPAGAFAPGDVGAYGWEVAR